MTDDDLWSTRRTSFGSAADAYAAGRPSYPDDALDWVLPPSAERVLDLAAGTRRLTEQLLARGLDVVAVEPDDALRAHVPAAATSTAGRGGGNSPGGAAVRCHLGRQAVPPVRR